MGVSQKIGGTFLGVPIIRIIVFWGPRAKHLGFRFHARLGKADLQKFGRASRASWCNIPFHGPPSTGNCYFGVGGFPYVRCNFPCEREAAILAGIHDSWKACVAQNWCLSWVASHFSFVKGGHD